MKRKSIWCVCLLFLLWAPILVLSNTKRITIVHTNDLHSHFLGFSPNIDYTPSQTDDDRTVGGWARIATAIKEVKTKRDNPVFVLDAGDFLMGSLFHMVCREEALELMLMKEMGIEVTTLGNHEFDLRPDGLARILTSANNKSAMPIVIASNIIFDPEDMKDESLEWVFQQGLVKRYFVLEKGGVKIGFFGLIGSNAAEVAPFASPIKFGEIEATARSMVQQLKDEQNVDIVICLSHSGLSDDKAKSEDENLAKNVPGIDIIISGHTHTKVEKPIRVNNTIIVQTGAYGHYLGVLDVSLTGKKTELMDYKLVRIDDSIKGDERISKKIDAAIQLVNKTVLKKYNLKFGQVVAETEFDLKMDEAETNLGNLITDALRWAVDGVERDPSDPSSRVRISIQSNGVIRDDILKGKTGKITVSDLFRVVPLGVGMDETLSYPLVSFYINAEEIKKTAEILTTIYPLKNDDYYLQFSGLRVEYNPNRMLFDRVTKLFLDDEEGRYERLDLSETNKKLYKVTSNIYNATFLKIIGGFTNNILVIVPKDKEGHPIEDLTTVRVDGDRSQPGIQEIKDWVALIKYIQTFEDKTGNGIPEIPERYRGTENRQIRTPSWSPVALLWGGNYVTWITFSAVVLATLILFLIVYIPRKLYRRRKNRRSRMKV